MCLVRTPFPVRSTDSQGQNTAELEDPSWHLMAWFAFGYLREMRATSRLRFQSALGRYGAGPAQYWQGCALLQTWRRGHDAEQELFSMHLSRLKTSVGMMITWLEACAYWTSSKCCLNVMLPWAAVEYSLWCIVKHEQDDDLHVKCILVNTEHLICSEFSAFPIL